ncbi:MAG: Ig-like domain-containing protein [Myxococcota bacterium]
MTRGSLPLLVTLLGGTLLHGGDARACDYVPTRTSFLMPGDGARDVPPNTRVWMGNTFDETQQFRLTDSAGNDVPGTMRELSGGYLNTDETMALRVFTPTRSLTPQETYQLTLPDSSSTTFTVGDREDLEAPPVPVVESRTYHPDVPSPIPSCGSCVARSVFRVTFNGMLLIGVLNDGPGFDEGTVSGGVSVLTTRGQATVVDARECQEDGRSEIRFAAVDMAGNLSGWSDSQRSDAGQCRCATPGGAEPWSLLTMTMLLALRTKRYRRAANTARGARVQGTTDASG